MTISWSRALCAGALLCAFAGPAARAAESGSEPLTLTEAIERAAQRNLAIATLLPERDAATLRTEAEALRPNDVLESELENFAGTGNTSGVHSLEATVRYSRTFELGDKQALRRRIGAAELDRLSSEQELRKLEIAAEVARRFIHALGDQEQLAATRRARELAQAARDAVRERVDMGASSPVALSRAEIALARTNIEEEHAEHELASSRVKLAAMWGQREAAFAELGGNLFDLPSLPALHDYRARIEASPELAQFAVQMQLHDARLRLADARRLPDVSVSAGIRRLQALDDQALVASFSVPLGTKRRAELERRSLQADRDRLELERKSRELELGTELFGLYQEIQHARTEAHTLDTQVRPQAAAMLRTTADGYRAGRFSLLELTDAQVQLLEVERDAIRAATQFHTFLIDLQRLVGAPINTLELGRVL